MKHRKEMLSAILSFITANDWQFFEEVAPEEEPPVIDEQPSNQKRMIDLSEERKHIKCVTITAAGRSRVSEPVVESTSSYFAHNTALKNPNHSFEITEENLYPPGELLLDSEDEWEKPVKEPERVHVMSHKERREDRKREQMIFREEMGDLVWINEGKNKSPKGTPAPSPERYNTLFSYFGY
jgi:virulence-associated protein VagC